MEYLLDIDQLNSAADVLAEGETVEDLIVATDSIQVMARQLDARELAFAQACRQLADAFGVHDPSSAVPRHHSMTLGTRYRPASVAGAMR